MALLSLIFSLGVLTSYSSLADGRDGAYYPKASCVMPSEARTDAGATSESAWDNYDACVLDYIERASNDREKVVFEVEKMVKGYVPPLPFSLGNASWRHYPSYDAACGELSGQPRTTAEDEECATKYVQKAQQMVDAIDAGVWEAVWRERK